MIIDWGKYRLNKIQGLIKKDLEKLRERDSLSDYLPWLFFNEKDKVFLNLDNTVGFMWELKPIPFMGKKQVSALESILKMEFPVGTVMQWILYPDHNVDSYIDNFKNNKKRKDSVALKSSKEYAKFLKKGTKGLKQTRNIPVRNFRAFLCIKSEEIISDDVIASVEETLANINLGPRRLTANDLVKWGRELFNNVDGHARSHYDKSKIISKQIINADTTLDFETKPSKIGNRYAKCLTPISTGDNIDALRANKMFGGIMGVEDDSKQITTPFLYSLNIILNEKAVNIHNKASATMSMQAVGSFSKELQRRLEEFGWALDKLASGDKFVQVIPSLWVFGDTPEAVTDSAARVKNIWEDEAGPNISIQIEDKIEVPLFISSLPFGLYNVDSNVKKLDRYFIWSKNSIARFIPIQADYTPPCELVVPGIGRKGQIGGIDFFDNRVNAHNFLVSAATGSGKSFLLNFICSNYYDAGAKVRLIDIGYSFKKLALIKKQRYIDVSKEKICINPLYFINNNEEDMKADVSAATEVIAQMVYSASGTAMPEVEYSLLKFAINWVINNGENEDGITKIYEYLKNYPNYDKSVAEHLPSHVKEIAQTMALNLYDFTKHGQFGRIFNGKSDFDIANDDLVIVELEGVAGIKELFSVMLMQILNSVTQDLYLSDRVDRRLILCEETATLLQKQGHSDFSRLGSVIEEGYRRARKYSGAFGIVLQTILDLMDKFGLSGNSILQNAIFQLFLEGTDYNNAVKKGIIEDVEGLALDLLNSVKKNNPNYSEVFMKSPLGMGVFRCAVDPWSYWVNTSKGEEVALFEKLLAKGLSPYDAISQLSGVQ